MKPLRILAILFIYGVVSVAWFILGGTTKFRTESPHSFAEREKVEGLWGSPHRQHSPFIEPVVGSKPGPPDGTATDPIRSTLDVELQLDHRMKGLRWYSLYDVRFAGEWDFDRENAANDQLVITLPDDQSIYDAFELTLNGERQEISPERGRIVVPLADHPGSVHVSLAYASRGQGTWQYLQRQGGGALKDFTLRMRTNFDEIDFPEAGLSPSSRVHVDGGTELEWRFSNTITTRGIGMVMPERIQPGELAAQLSFTAPISLLFFFLVVLLLSKLENLDVHPVNYMFLAASFFSFHLLFAYTVDRLPLGVAFGLASAVSVSMVTTYLRLVVSAKFGFLKAGVAQLVYLVGFSAAHFLEGFTGLTVTVLSIATLFLCMLLTGRVRWSEALAPASPAGPPRGPYRAEDTHVVTAQ
jgi:hypothetical protein